MIGRSDNKEYTVVEGDIDLSFVTWMYNKRTMTSFIKTKELVNLIKIGHYRIAPSKKNKSKKTTNLFSFDD